LAPDAAKSEAYLTQIRSQGATKVTLVLENDGIDEKADPSVTALVAAAGKAGLPVEIVRRDPVFVLKGPETARIGDSAVRLAAQTKADHFSFVRMEGGASVNAVETQFKGYKTGSVILVAMRLDMGQAYVDAIRRAAQEKGLRVYVYYPGEVRPAVASLDIKGLNLLSEGVARAETKARDSDLEVRLGVALSNPEGTPTVAVGTYDVREKGFPAQGLRPDRVAGQVTLKMVDQDTDGLKGQKGGRRTRAVFEVTEVRSRASVKLPPEISFTAENGQVITLVNETGPNGAPTKYYVEKNARPTRQQIGSDIEVKAALVAAVTVDAETVRPEAQELVKAGFKPADLATALERKENDPDLVMFRGEMVDLRLEGPDARFEQLIEDLSTVSKSVRIVPQTDLLNLDRAQLVQYLKTIFSKTDNDATVVVTYNSDLPIGLSRILDDTGKERLFLNLYGQDLLTTLAETRVYLDTGFIHAVSVEGDLGLNEGAEQKTFFVSADAPEETGTPVSADQDREPSADQAVEAPARKTGAQSACSRRNRDSCLGRSGS
jgi:hypothetical protein